MQIWILVLRFICYLLSTYTTKTFAWKPTSSFRFSQRPHGLSSRISLSSSESSPLSRGDLFSESLLDRLHCMTRPQLIGSAVSPQLMHSRLGRQDQPRDGPARSPVGVDWFWGWLELKTAMCIQCAIYDYRWIGGRNGTSTRFRRDLHLRRSLIQAEWGSCGINKQNAHIDKPY